MLCNKTLRLSGLQQYFILIVCLSLGSLCGLWSRLGSLMPLWILAEIPPILGIGRLAEI